MADTKVSIITLPDVLGAEWTEEGTTYQLCVSRGSSVVAFGTKRAGGTWVHTTVTNPERFGPIPTTPKSMRAFAEAFVA